MGAFLATTRVAILRGGEPDTLGDEIEDNDDGAIVEGLDDVPASIIETTKRVYDPSTGTRRTVRNITGRMPVQVGHPSTGEPVIVELQDGDRIRDNVSGRIYALSEHTDVARDLSGASSLTLDLKDTASA
jgi:hypothetical protein